MLFRSISSVAIVLLIVVFAVFLSVVFGDLQSDVDYCRPRQVHLSYGVSTTDVIVMWSTTGQCTTMVKFSKQPYGTKTVITGDNRSFSTPWAEGAKRVSHVHRVVLRNLEPGTTFYYQPTSNEISVGPYIFTTPPASKLGEKSSVQILALGDLNSSSPVFQKLIQEVEESGKYSAIIHPGNMAMNLNGRGGKNGDLYLKMMEAILKQVPYLTAPGPAESENGTFSHYLHRFSMPSLEWPMTKDRMWYSVDIGPVHLVSYSTEVLNKEKWKYIAQQQHNWLVNDLEKANGNRKKTPWIVAFGHCPMICASKDPALTCNKKKSQTAEKFWDAMYNEGVDLIVSSYGKAYEISYPMVKNVQIQSNYTNPTAPVHATLGSASPWTSKYNFTKEPWLNLLHDDETPLTFGRIHVENSSLLHLEMVSLKDLKVLDSITIEQSQHGKFSKAELPEDISDKIEDTQTIAPASGIKPLNTIREILREGGKNKLIIGVSVGAAVLLILIAVLILRKVLRGRRRQSSRRWENMDINYGKRYYNKAPDKDDLDNDFEIDMTETTAPSRKLLSDD